MKHIACDPSGLRAKKEKPCVFWDGLYDPEFIYPSDWVGIMNVLREYSHGGLTHIVIEDGYVRHPKASIMLAEARQRIEILALGEGLSVVRVNPKVWQGEMLSGAFGGDMKDKSCTVASTITGYTILRKHNDLADTVCIWDWARKHISLGDMQDKALIIEP